MVLSIIDQYGLIVINPFWPILTHFDPFWPILTHLPSLAHYLILIESMDVNTCSSFGVCTGRTVRRNLAGHVLETPAWNAVKQTMTPKFSNYPVVSNQGKLAGWKCALQWTSDMATHHFTRAPRAPTLFCRSFHGKHCWDCWEALVVLVDSITQCVAQKPQDHALRKNKQQVGQIDKRPAIFQSLMESGVSCLYMSL